MPFGTHVHRDAAVSGTRDPTNGWDVQTLLRHRDPQMHQHQLAQRTTG